MNKLLIGILAGLVVIIGLLVNLTSVIQSPPEKLGARPDATVKRLASTTIDGLGTYFGDCCEGLAPNDTRTPTTTLLTIQGLANYDSVTIDITSVSTTTSAGGTVYIQPEVSLDAATWSSLPVGIVTNTGTFTKDITLNTGVASTSLLWSPNVTGTGTSTAILPPFKDLAANWLRIRVASTGTSTISVGARVLSQ